MPITNVPLVAKQRGSQIHRLRPLIEPEEKISKVYPIAESPEPREIAPNSQLREEDLIQPSTLESDGTGTRTCINGFDHGDMAIEFGDDPLSPGYDDDDPPSNNDDILTDAPVTSMADMLASHGADKETASGYIKKHAKKT